MNDDDAQVIDFPSSKIVRIQVNSPHDCNDPASPPPFKDQNCKCNRIPPAGEQG